MNQRTFAYAIYIAATPERIWQALTGGEFFEKCWGGRRVESDWKLGALVKFYQPNGRIEWVGEVRECYAPRKLVHTWYDPADDAQTAAPEVVTWQIEPSGSAVVKLQLIHDRLSAEAFQDISHVWPALLSSLKSLLETGKPLAYDD